MGKLLTILGADDKIQEKLPADLFQAEKVIIGLQEIYSKAPESPKKNQLAIAISEAVRVMMARLNPYLVKDEVEEKTEEEEKKLPDEKEAPRVRKEQPKPPMPPVHGGGRRGGAVREACTRGPGTSCDSEWVLRQRRARRQLCHLHLSENRIGAQGAMRPRAWSGQASNLLLEEDSLMGGG